MKKKNGFTLIELLAVIIILGVLMLVAIPSVTSYINNSRKSAYADTAANYIKGATNLVNEGQKYQFFDENVLYMIPVGHDTTKSCVALESGGQSPYNNEYAEAYVGVVYDNDKGSYTYFFTSVDGSGQGFEFNSSYDISGTSKDTTKRGADLVKAGLKPDYTTLIKCYKGDNADCKKDAVVDMTDTDGADITAIIAKAAEVINDTDKNPTKVRIIGATKCQ
jgi:prepilin-type N-terminal cleavage/methylation domain-containing protein